MSDLYQNKYVARPVEGQKRTIAERGWLGALIDDTLRPALQMAEKNLSDLDNLDSCSVAGCERLFDKTDPRSGSYVERGVTYPSCPACEIEHDVVKAEAALALAKGRTTYTGDGD